MAYDLTKVAIRPFIWSSLNGISGSFDKLWRAVLCCSPVRGRKSAFQLENNGFNHSPESRLVVNLLSVVSSRHDPTGTYPSLPPPLSVGQSKSMERGEPSAQTPLS